MLCRVAVVCAQVVFTSLRFTLAAAAFAPFLHKGLSNPTVRRAGFEIGMWTALGYIAQSWALSMTPASRASLLSTFTVLGVPCLAGLSGQKVKPLVWACGIAALIGTTLLEQGGGEPPNAGEDEPQGGSSAGSADSPRQQVYWGVLLKAAQLPSSMQYPLQLQVALCADVCLCGSWPLHKNS